MKRIFLFFILQLVVFYAIAQGDREKVNCSIVKTGTFRYLDIPDTTAFFRIKKENHTEYHRDGKYHIKSKVKWISDCQYEMKMLSNTIPDFPFKPGAVMLVTILRIEGDIIHYSAEIGGDKWYGRLLKLE
ncbi:hypothetical protein [Paraflavitalea sp. CAU 1676]|uniref:hypothetical protein n=1 Tax=Paraflavitalea sp. CAU 1676 TaxID=3032598 RepID=UPI0023DAA944|nr:hypothetical protein [Paraflavitalea sp. CAU 1676]MDF2189138.1 hypothetical protein [Paraflavitalea sp. CAU 1676]